jgi:hypothetical protein
LAAHFEASENQRFTSEIDNSHLKNISTWIQLLFEVIKKGEVVFQKKNLAHARFKPHSLA